MEKEQEQENKNREEVAVGTAEQETKSPTAMDTDPVEKRSEKTDHKIIGRCFEILEKPVDGIVTIKTIEGYIAHYYIEILKNNSMALEMVDEKGEPTGELLDKMTTDEFAKRFKTCSQHYCQLQPKTVDEISEKMAENRVLMGEKDIENGDFEGAEEKFERALNFDENNVKASFGLGKSKLELEKIDEAMAIFKKISDENNIYEESNKHTMNDFGIYLRRKGLHNQAISSYEKAIALCKDDEVLFFNIGRAYAEKSYTLSDPSSIIALIQKAIGILREALHVKADFKEASDYLDVLLETEQRVMDEILKGTDTKEADSNQAVST